MMVYYALAPFKAYLFTAFVWFCIIAPIALVAAATLKRTTLLFTLLGTLVIVAAIPITYMVELSVNGCCGQQATSFRGVGLVAGGIVGLLGMLLIVFRRKLSK